MKRVVIILLLVCFFVNCNIESYMQEQVSKPYTPEDEPQIDEPEEVYIMNNFTVNPISEYPHYINADNSLFGFNETASSKNDLEKIIPVITIEGESVDSKCNEFFRIGGKVYFTISHSFYVEGAEPEIITKYICQENGAITEMTSKTFPACPVSERIEFEADPFKVEKTMYGDIETSTWKQGTSQEAFKCIDSAICTDVGLMFSVPVTYETREKGVYLKPLDKPKSKIQDSGRIW